ncbi:MAG: hypothetical protein KGR48_06810 [Alphaproteobacteria bacterium]|nr:hypothetical protein [Alphaproteobacteria bacterium]MDE2011416.1 hypothetical protein [Alphaproteobacteria bacterium]MDE2071807.1 hypothetical protein [Alphaproteobacteria bacterium]MDE2350413.1 hypothetical protein [Alphaproteobacteria bacterium]
MRIVAGVMTVLLLGAALSGCVAVDAVGTAASAAGTVVGTAADVGSGVASTAADTISGSSSDDQQN